MGTGRGAELGRPTILFFRSQSSTRAHACPSSSELLSTVLIGGGSNSYCSPLGRCDYTVSADGGFALGTDLGRSVRGSLQGCPPDANAGVTDLALQRYANIRAYAAAASGGVENSSSSCGIAGAVCIDPNGQPQNPSSSGVHRLDLQDRRDAGAVQEGVRMRLRQFQERVRLSSTRNEPFFRGATPRNFALQEGAAPLLFQQCAHVVGAADRTLQETLTAWQRNSSARSSVSLGRPEPRLLPAASQMPSPRPEGTARPNLSGRPFVPGAPSVSPQRECLWSDDPNGENCAENSAHGQTPILEAPVSIPAGN